MAHFWLNLLVLGCIQGIMITGLNIQYGYGGLLNFAFYSYVGLGAYIAGVTTLGKAPQGASYILQWHLPWYLGLLLAGVAAAILGAFVFSFTVRRLRSDYLAIVTVAFAYIFYNVLNTNSTLFNAATGIYNVPYITGNANLSPNQYSFVVLAVAVPILIVFVFIARRIFRSPFGRLLRATREDEIVVKSFGRVIWLPQLVVYIMGSFMAGVAGGIFIFYITAWSPAAMMPIESFFLLSALVIGGAGNYWGALLGTVLVTEGLLELSRYLPKFGNIEDASAIRIMSIGIGLILILRFRAEGLAPERWLHWYRRARPKADAAPRVSVDAEARS
jgi:branched-chain amino acid transport system permease protein